MIANRQSLRILLTWLSGVLACLASGTSDAQEITWKTGTLLRRQLDGSSSVTLSQQPLRQTLTNLSRNTGVAIFLDRRIDADREIELSATDVPLAAVLDEAASKADGAMCVIGSVIYIGPASTASKLPTLVSQKRQEIAALQAPAKTRLLKAETWKWEELSEPHDLIKQLAEKGGVSVQNLEVVPHDLWAAGDFPALAWPERMTLALAGFGLTFEVSRTGTALRLVPMPDNPRIEQTYSPRAATAVAQAEVRRLFPGASTEIEGAKLKVLATAEEHEKIARLMAGQTVKTKTTTSPDKRYSLTVERQPAGAVMKTISNQIKRELKYDAEVGQKLREPVTFTVADVPLEELLEKTLGPLGLSYKLDEMSLEVVVSK